jgi:antitoxin CptB
MDDRRKQLRFRAWRRGFRELDLILGGFADAHLSALGPEELELFAALLDAPDQEVYSWIIGQVPTPADYATPLFARIQAAAQAGMIHG